jgi:lysophospholipase L1-like esterase
MNARKFIPWLLTVLIFFLVGELLFIYSAKIEGENYSKRAAEIKHALKHAPRYYAVNNLNYIPNKDFKGAYSIMDDVRSMYFNQAGYRGESVSLTKDSGNIRLVFLGGSTTIQEGGISLLSTYPEQTKAALHSLIEAESHQIEVINGALDGANSFDILQAYLFKYKYFQPDWVIIHSGFNDCAFYYDTIYYPDYTHLQLSLAVDHLNSFQRHSANFLLTFKMSAWFLIRYIDKHFQSAEKLLKEATKHREHFPVWMSMSPEEALSEPRFNAFYNNIKTLAQNALMHQSKVVLVQMPYPSGHDYYSGIFGKAIRQHNHFMANIGKELNIPVVTTADIGVPDSCFTDLIHVDSIGNALKGRAVAEKMASLQQP